MLAFEGNVYKSRREQLLEYFDKGKIVLLGNNNSPRNYKDNYYQFRQDSTFLYFIGISMPGLNAILDAETGTCTLYGDEIDIDDIIWTGKLPTLSSIAEQSDIETVRSSGTFKSDLNGDLHLLPPYRADHQLLIASIDGLNVSEKLVDAIVNIRSNKSAEEITLMDQASKISHGMHEHVMTNMKPEMYEYELVGLAKEYAWRHHCNLAYPAILTINGQTLHNHHHHNQLKDGQLLLFDGGIELGSGYCGDITRTTPVNGHYTIKQSEIHHIVEQAYNAAVIASTPGTAFADVHTLAGRTITKGLHALGIVTGDIEEAMAEGVHTLFFPHGLGHMIGLDVHDMENLGEDRVGYDQQHQRSESFGTRFLRLGRKLEPGFCITIEPGIYFIPELIDKWRAEGKWKHFINYEKLESYKNFGGIRIEDDFLITSTSNRRLGGDLSTNAQELEALMI